MQFIDVLFPACVPSGIVHDFLSAWAYRWPLASTPLSPLSSLPGTVNSSVSYAWALVAIVVAWLFDKGLDEACLSVRSAQHQRRRREIYRTVDANLRCISPPQRPPRRNFVAPSSPQKHFMSLTLRRL